MENKPNFIDPKFIERLSSVGRELSNLKDTQVLLESTARLLHDELGAETVAIFLLEEGCLKRKAVVGIDATQLAEETYNIGQGLTGRSIFKSGTNYVGASKIFDKAYDEDHIDHVYLEQYRKLLATGEVHHLLTAPITAADEVIGVVRLVNKKLPNQVLSPNGFDLTDLALLYFITANMVINLQAIENNKRLQELRDAIEALSKAETGDEAITLQNYMDKVSYYIETILQPEGYNFYRCEGDTLRLDKSSYLLPEAYPPPLTVSKGYGRGLIVKAADDQQTHNYPDKSYLSDPDYNPELLKVHKHLHSQVYSLLIVPVVDSSNETRGVLSLVNKRGPYGVTNFSPEDEDRARILGASFAQALRREELFQRKEQNQKHLSQLVQMFQDVVDEKVRVEEALNEIARRSKEVFEANLVCIYPFLPGALEFRRDLLIFAGQRVSETPINTPRPAGITNRVLESEEGALWLDLANEDKAMATNFLKDEQITALLGAKIAFEGQNLGVFYFYYRNKPASEQATVLPRKFSDWEKDWLKIIASYTAQIFLIEGYQRIEAMQDDFVHVLAEIQQVLQQQSLLQCQDVVLTAVEQIYPFAKIEFAPNPQASLEYPIKDAEAKAQAFISVAKDVTQPDYTERLGLQLLANSISLVMHEQLLKERISRATEKEKRLRTGLQSFEHDLRFPIPTAKDAVKVLEQILNSQNDPTLLTQVKNPLDRLSRQLNRVHFAVERVTRLERYVDNEPVPKANDLNVLIEDALRKGECEWQARVRDVKLSFVGQDNLPSITTDGDYVSDIIYYIVENAIKFTSPHGQIKISSRLSKTKNRLKVIIKDTGCGIDPVDLSHIFESGYQGRHAQEISTGKGLYIVDQLLSWLGGRCEVKSTLGKGSTFSIFLPLERSVQS